MGQECRLIQAQALIGEEEESSILDNGRTQRAAELVAVERVFGASKLVGEEIGRIEVSGAVRGTAFLVGPQAVLTCQHVIRPLLRDDGEPRKGPPDTLVRFDLYEAPGGTTAGVPCPLAEKGWLLDALPPSALDEQRDPKPDPAADELDYALLKLNEPIADRTCLEPVEEALDIGDPLHILHYPGTGPLRLSLDTRAASLFSRGRVLLYAPSGYEGLLEKVWPVVTRRIPAGYDLIVRAPEPPAPAPALHRQLPRAA